MLSRNGLASVEIELLLKSPDHVLDVPTAIMAPATPCDLERCAEQYL